VPSDSAKLGALLVAVLFVVIVDVRDPIQAHKEARWAEDMKGDLRNLVVFEDQWQRDSGKYLTTVKPILRVQAGVHTPTVTLTSDGWTAVVGHDWTSRRCTVFVGTTPIAPATRPREPECT